MALIKKIVCLFDGELLRNKKIYWSSSQTVQVLKVTNLLRTVIYCEADFVSLSLLPEYSKLF
jgi:hypothetical protein